MSQNTRGTSANFALTTFVLAASLTFVMFAVLSNRTVVEREALPATATPLPTPTLIAALPTPFRVEYTGRMVSEGKSYFQTSCSSCHGQAAQGVPGLGKNLLDSTLVQQLDDRELLDFIVVGRTAFDPANTTGITMPARGGNPALTDNNIYAIIAYLRTAADPSLIVVGGSQPAMPQGPIEIRPTEPWVYPLATPEGQPTSTPRPPRPFDAAHAYAVSCAGCHGLDGAGMAVNGPPLAASALVTAGDAAALFDFIVTGNPDADPANLATGFPHPVRAEYPALDDNDLRALVDYVLVLAAR